MSIKIIPCIKLWHTEVINLKIKNMLQVNLVSQKQQKFKISSEVCYEGRSPQPGFLCVSWTKKNLKPKSRHVTLSTENDPREWHLL